MKNKITAFLAAWLCIAFTFASAQTDIKINGQVNYADGKPADGITIMLVKATDSVLVKTALTNTKGAYLYENIPAGQYRVFITLMGYQSYKSAAINSAQNQTLPLIILQQSSTMLKSVAVTSQKPLIEQKIDRTVMNVDALINNAGSTALDVLEKAPGVMVEQNGGISLKGKGDVKIYIDDKPTYLSGADLDSYLRSLPASSIDQVEIMTNPPAKYDAAGSGGIINIRTKRTKAVGFNGGINLSYSQGKYARTNNSLNFNYRNNKVNAFGNLSYSTGNGFSDLDINRHFIDGQGNTTANFLQNSFIRRTSQSYNVKIGLDYYATERTTWGIGFTGLANPGHVRTVNTSKLSDAQNRLDSIIVAHNEQYQHFKNGGINLNYRHQYDKNGRELTADADYLNYTSGNDQSFNNISYLPSGAVANNDLLTGALPGKINIYAVKTDYTQPLKSGIKLMAGAKASFTQTDNIANYFYTAHGVTSADYDKTNHFIYKENINAAYLNTSKDFKRLSVQFGLRLENTVSNGHQLGNARKPDSVFNRNYTGLFPTFYLQYKLDTAGRQSLSINYGRRINRPYYQDLNPFLSPLDKFTYYTGNPFLKPAYSDNIELIHTWKNITTTLSYSKTRDEENETIEIVNGIYYSRPGNLGSTVNKGISVDAGFDITRWLNIHVFTYALNIHTVSSFYTGTLNTQGTVYFGRSAFQFKTGKDWTIQLDGGFQTKVTSAQFIAGSRGRANLALSKKLSPATTVKLVVNDLFYTFVNSGVINNLANTRADYRNLSDTRTAVVSLSYRFGKTIANLRKHDADGADSEKNRVKN